MKTSLLYIVTALAEIFGGYAVFLWLRLHKPCRLDPPRRRQPGLFSWLEQR